VAAQSEILVMAQRRGRFSLNAPRHLTFLVSLVLVLLAVMSMHVHLPAIQGVVAAHRFWLVVAGYVVLTLGVLLPGL
jgi:predicted membrane channel-forming protein YqfA (hemolysin III family)